MRRRNEEKRRGVETRRRRAIILMAVEGANKTEKNYFSHFNTVQNKYHIRFAPGNATDPRNMKEALRREIDKGEFNPDDGDKAYCVFDIDGEQGKSAVAKELVADEQKDGIEYVLSNPCFEVWYICHFNSSTKHLKDGDAAINELKSLMPSYSKGADVFSMLEAKSEAAVANAKRLEKFHAEQERPRGDARANPYTEVYRVVELLKS
jgi:hypothetical protein